MQNDIGSTNRWTIRTNAVKDAVRQKTAIRRQFFAQIGGRGREVGGGGFVHLRQIGLQFVACHSKQANEIITIQQIDQSPTCSAFQVSWQIADVQNVFCNVDGNQIPISQVVNGRIKESGAVAFGGFARTVAFGATFRIGRLNPKKTQLK